MLTKSQYRALRWVGHHEYATVKSVFTVWYGSLTANWRYECHSVVSSRRSEPPHRTLAWLFQCVSTAQRDAERRWTAETASSLGVVYEFVDVRWNGSRQRLVRDDRYFVLDALLDMQPVERL